MNITYQQPGPEGKEWEILSPGWYNFKVITVYDTDRDGNPLVSRNGQSYLKLVCIEGESGVSILHFLFLAEENAHKISALIHACRLAVEDGQQLVINCETFLGAEFRGRVDANTGFDGIFRNRIIRVNPLVAEEEAGPLEVVPRENDSDASQFVEDQQTNAMDPEEEDEVPF